MNIKNFLKKYRIHLIYGINMIPSYLLYSTFTDIVFDIKHEYSYRNQLIAVELIFLLLSFILIFSLYKYYKRKYKKNSYRLNYTKYGSIQRYNYQYNTHTS